MKNIGVFCMILCCGVMGYGQVGIGTTTPNAALEVSSSTNGGFLVPHYALLGANDATTVVNPTGMALVAGTLIYNTTTVSGGNAVNPGLVYWDGNAWRSVVPRTQILMRRFVAGGIGASGTVFNFPSASFNTIDGSSYGGTAITLPTGVYKIESNLRLNSSNTVDWAARLDGTVISGSVSGSANPTTFATNASTSPQMAIVEITASTGVIDFVVTGGSGAAVITGQCFVIIEKLE